MFETYPCLRALLSDLVFSNNEKDKIVVPKSQERIEIVSALLVYDHKMWKELRRVWSTVS